MASSIFISYRRNDTTGEAGRLADSLENLLGAACVFRDADDIPAGEDFDVVLKRELAETEVIVVLIGKKWQSELAERLNRPDPDFVRIEIATALQLGKRVIPVLLQGAELPAAAALPDDLRRLINRQAINLRDEAWNADANRLADAIGRPYAWGKAALRATAFLIVAVVATKYCIAALAPETADQLSLARTTIVILLTLYVSAEAAWWWQRRKKT